MIYMHVFDQLCSMLIQNAMRQAHFLLYLLCEKCCRMTYIIWLPVQWVHQLSYYFVYVISVCCAIAPSPDHAPTPSVPSAPRHVPTRVASGGACCLLRRVPPPWWKFCWPSLYPKGLRDWSLWKIRIAEKLLNWLTATVNQKKGMRGRCRCTPPLQTKNLPTPLRWNTTTAFHCVRITDL